MRVLESPRPDGGAVFDLSFSPCGRRLIGTDSDHIFVWNLSDSSLWPWRVLSDENVADVAQSPCGRYIVGASNQSLIVWNVQSDRKPMRLSVEPSRDRGPDYPFTNVGFSPDGSVLMSVMTSIGVWRWRVGSWHRLTGFDMTDRLDGHRALIEGMFTVHPTGHTMAAVISSSRKNTSVVGIRVWDYHAARALAGAVIPAVKALDYINRLRYSPDGRWLAFVRWPWRIDVLDAVTLTPIAEYAPKIGRRRPAERVGDFAFHPSGRWFGVVGDLGRVDCVDTETGQLLRSFDWQIGPTRGIAFSPDGTLAAVSGDNGTVVVWDVDD